MTTRNNTAKKIVKQTIAWTLVVSAIAIFSFTLSYYDSSIGRNIYTKENMAYYVSVSFIISLFGTLHYHWAYLKLFSRKLYVQYVLGCVAVFALAVALCFLEYVLVNRPHQLDVAKVQMLLTRFATMPLIFGVPFAILYTALHEACKAKAKRKEIESTSRETAMLLLAKKLEPHFLFNTLNAIYAIAQQENATTTIATIDRVAESLRERMNTKPVESLAAVKTRKGSSFGAQFLYVWLGVVVFTIGIEGFADILSGRWHRDPVGFLVYQPVMLVLVAFTVTGHYYLLYKPYIIGKEYGKYFSLLLPFTLAMIVLDVSVDYFLIEVVKLFGGDDESMGRFIMVALARVLTGEAIAAWVYATVSHYRYNRRERDAALKQQENNERMLVQSRADTDVLFLLLQQLEGAVSDENAPGTGAAVTELVSLFRYSAGHAGDITVALTEEFTFLRRYVHLQQMRIRQGSGVRVTTSIETNNDDARIAPLLLLPYIENAFKYGISYVSPSFIDINITVSGNELKCAISNTDHAAAKKRDVNKGMGLADTLKRLQLQYEGKFGLEYGSKEGVYTVNLRLELV